MKLMRNLTRIVLAAAGFAAVVPAFAAPDPLPHSYPCVLMIVSNLGSDLYLTLDPKFQKGLNPNPVQVENTDAPVITPVALNDGTKVRGKVSISAGYINLLNHLAHAKAIDHIQPGFYQQYTLNLGRESGGGVLPDPPDMLDNRYWTDDVMNDQASYFNQMLGMTLALNLSHHYLGLFDQYSGEMLAGKLVPINNFISPGSWEAGVKAATLNCLNCAVALDGAKALFDAIDRMPRRPAWTAFVAPPAADLKKVNKQLKTYEDQYFHGQLK